MGRDRLLGRACAMLMLWRACGHPSTNNKIGLKKGSLTSDAAFGDARAAILRLTDSGRGVYEDYRLALIRASNRHLEELDADEKQRLVTIFKKIGARGRG